MCQIKEHTFQQSVLYNQSEKSKSKFVSHYLTIRVTNLKAHFSAEGIYNQSDKFKSQFISSGYLISRVKSKSEFVSSYRTIRVAKLRDYVRLYFINHFLRFTNFLTVISICTPAGT